MTNLMQIDTSHKNLVSAVYNFIWQDISQPVANIKYRMKANGFNAFMGLQYMGAWTKYNIIDIEIVDDSMSGFYDNYMVEFTIPQTTIDEMTFYKL